MSIRNIEDLNLDDITEETLREERDALAEDYGVDSREGSIYYDATEAHILRAAKFFDDLRKIDGIISLDTCTGDVLDEWLRLKGMTRNPIADTPATYAVTFSGTAPEVGEEMSCDDHMFVLTQDENDDYFIVSEETGTEMNSLSQGLPVIPEIDVDGLISATLGALSVPAVDQEDDDTARARLIAALAGPTENANKAQLMAWCEEVSGVGHARIISLWDGDNTAKGVIISTAGGVPAASVVSAVQAYVDPNAAGLGEGRATIGLKFTAVAATALQMNVTVSITLTAGSTLANVKAAIKEALEEYFAELALGRNTDTPIVRVSKIGSIISAVEGVDDYADLDLNSGESSVTCTASQIPVLGTFTVTETEEEE